MNNSNRLLEGIERLILLTQIKELEAWFQEARLPSITILKYETESLDEEGKRRFAEYEELCETRRSQRPSIGEDLVQTQILLDSPDVRKELEKIPSWEQLVHQLKSLLKRLNGESMTYEQVGYSVPLWTSQDRATLEEFKDKFVSRAELRELTQEQTNLILEDPIIAKRLWLLENMSVDVKDSVVTFKNKAYTVNAETALFFFRVRESWPNPVSCKKEELKPPSEIRKTLQHRELCKLVGKNSGGATLNLDDVM